MKIACVQINGGGDMAANISKAQTLVQEAASRGARLVALPENVFFMEEPSRGVHRTLYTPAEHPGVKAAAEMAKTHRCWLLVGSLAVKIDESGKTVNRSLLYNPNGELVSQYDKVHLFDVALPNGETYAESAKMLPGREAVLADVEGVKLGLTICYDLRFPHLYRALAQAGADIIAVPAAFTQVTGEAHWHVLLRARAIETGCFIIAPAQTGMHPGNRRTYGHALIIDPWGNVLADAGTDEGVITADIDLSMVASTRAKIPSLSHDREFTLKQA